MFERPHGLFEHRLWLPTSSHTITTHTPLPKKESPQTATLLARFRAALVDRFLVPGFFVALGNVAGRARLLSSAVPLECVSVCVKLSFASCLNSLCLYHTHSLQYEFLLTTGLQ